jgi:hypothetical protein
MYIYIYMHKYTHTYTVCQTEDEMTPLVSLTGHISSFFELMRVTQDWAVNNGVDVSTARSYVSSFYSSLAASTGIFYYFYVDSHTYAFGWSVFSCRIRFCDTLFVTFFK